MFHFMKPLSSAFAVIPTNYYQGVPSSLQSRDDKKELDLQDLFCSPFQPCASEKSLWRRSERMRDHQRSDVLEECRTPSHAEPHCQPEDTPSQLCHCLPEGRGQVPLS